MNDDLLPEIKAWLATERAAYPDAANYQPDKLLNYLPGKWINWLIAEVERLQDRDDARVSQP